MINAVLERMFLEKIDRNRCLCTLELSRKKFPGSKVNLNALCRKFGISLKSRETHGALVDSFLLAEVYLELLGGKQRNLFIDKKKETSTINRVNKINEKLLKTPLVKLSPDDIQNHQNLMAKLENPIWNI